MGATAHGPTRRDSDNHQLSIALKEYVSRLDLYRLSLVHRLLRKRQRNMVLPLSSHRASLGRPREATDRILAHPEQST